MDQHYANANQVWKLGGARGHAASVGQRYRDRAFYRVLKAQAARLIEAREPAKAAPTSVLAWAVWAVARTGKSLAAQSQTVSYQVGSFFPQPEKFPIDAGGEDDVH
jgi:hypothetical protein